MNAPANPQPQDRADAVIARLSTLHPRVIDLSLGRIARLLERMGDPQRRLPPTIHVAGTNGKGSTIAFLRAILEAAGERVHVYTSPHLVRFHERIRLGAAGGGRLVDDAELVAALERCERLNAGEPITSFEIATAAALQLFADHPADFLLLEVGLGGRFDATNVINAPAASVITPVSIDHVDFLGDTVDKIAFEKAGILKTGAPAVFASQTRAALAVLEREAVRRGVRPLIAGEDFHAREENGRLVYEDERGLLDLPAPRLAGRHQFDNAATAIATVRLLRPDLPAVAFERGLTQVDWPARLQQLNRGRLAGLAPAGAELWLDGGHNADGGKALAQAMADLEERAPRPLVLICGMLTTKDSSAFLAAFRGLAQELIAVPVGEGHAGRAPEEIARRADAAGVPAAASPSIEAALRFLAARRWPTPPRLLICGSLYLAGEALKADGTIPA
ncbi:MAG: bifunctional folylpolyglutamate synthase/dihydrofolate synthase [Methylobacteriaceae bacterium]|nr:bifunctional folylpolyglutamate synthase/dihydrofolate synthase [Methylobacteriaceae bacterium]